jgi:hypothetical protein
VFAVLGEARRAVHLRLTSNPETVLGQKSASRRSPRSPFLDHMPVLRAVHSSMCIRLGSWEECPGFFRVSLVKRLAVLSHYESMLHREAVMAKLALPDGSEDREDE